MAKKAKLDTRSIHICTDRNLPPALVGKAFRIAIEERKDNLVVPKGPKVMGALGHAMATVPQPISAKMAVLSKRLWKPGKTLKVRLLQKVSAHIADRVEHYAKEWSKYADLKFAMATTGGDIRVSFDKTDGSWSYLGTEAKLIGANKATMNYGWLEDDTAEDEFSRVILHEFGHAIGCIHEHNHPASGIPWNKPVVYAYYAQTQGWTKADVDQQVFATYAISQLNAGKYDRKSIMHYAIPKELLLPGSTAVGWNRVLSPNDKAFIRGQYP
jgi:hypothetical protein